VEGLVPSRTLVLYYGTADSRVGVAVWDPKQRMTPRLADPSRRIV